MLNVFRQILSIGTTTFAFVAATFVAYMLAFGLVRAIVLPILLQIPLVAHLLRPFFGHFVRGRWSVVHLWQNRTLVWHSFLLGLTTIGGWELAESLFDDRVQEVRVIFYKGTNISQYLCYSPWP